MERGGWREADGERWMERVVERKDIYLVPAGFVRDIFDVAVDVVHGVGLGGDVLFGGLGDGVVLGNVCHFVWLLVLLKICIMFR